MSEPSQVVVLAEDKRTERFIWCFLRCLSYSRHQYRSLVTSHGSGEKFVREYLPREVRALRARQASSVLIAVVDADSGTVDNRRNQLLESLKHAGVPRPTSKEPIIILIPRRNIETWLTCLLGSEADEIRDYKPNPGTKSANELDGKVPLAGEKFYSTTRPNESIPQTFVDSLRRAIPEAGRVPRSER